MRKWLLYFLAIQSIWAETDLVGYWRFSGTSDVIADPASGTGWSGSVPAKGNIAFGWTCSASGCVRCIRYVSK